MDVARLGLGVVAEDRMLPQTIVNRFENFREGSEKFRDLNRLHQYKDRH